MSARSSGSKTSVVARAASDLDRLASSPAASAPVARHLVARLAEQVEDPQRTAIVIWTHVLADPLDVKAFPFALDDEDDAPDVRLG